MAHVSLITLVVDDPERAARFCEAMGWRRSDAFVDGTITFLRGGAAVLALFGRNDLAGEVGVELAVAGRRPPLGGGPQSDLLQTA